MEIRVGARGGGPRARDERAVAEVGALIDDADGA